MTMMLELLPDLEERLRAEAAKTGEDVETLLRRRVRLMLASIFSSPDAAPPRVAGLDRGQIGVSDDFDAPLPE